MGTITAKAASPTALREGFAIAILDDDPAIIHMLEAMTQQLGLDAIGTNDPHQVLGLIAEGRCRVVISDLKMPAMDGLTFLRNALDRDPGVYVLLMTGLYSLDSAI